MGLNSSDQSPSKAIDNTFMNNSSSMFNSDLVQSHVNKWNQNFQYILGPANTAFVDATLDYQNIVYNYRLDYNPNGILWRVNGAGIVHPDDLDNYFEQNRIIETTTKYTVAEIENSNNLSPFGTGGGSEADSEKAKEVILSKGSFNNSLNNSGDLRAAKEVETGPGTIINAAFSNAIYNDGIHKTPKGFWSIGDRYNPLTDYYAEYFTDGTRIVVVFRGTVLKNLKSLVESDRQLLFGKAVAQFNDVNYTMKQLEQIVADNPKLQGLPISATGHSLGGAAAQYFTRITGYPSETFGAPGIINSLKDQEDDLIGADRMPVINHVNKYDCIGIAELGGHIGAVRVYDMHPANVIPGWNDGLFIEHSMDTYQAYFRTIISE